MSALRAAVRVLSAPLGIVLDLLARAVPLDIPAITFDREQCREWAEMVDAATVTYPPIREEVSA